MADMKNKVKGLVKKVNDQFQASSSTGKFKGQGRVLGSASSSSGPANSIPNRNLPGFTPNKNRTSLNSNIPVVDKPKNDFPEKKIENLVKSNPEEPSTKSDGFDPFEPLITSGNRNRNGYSLNVLECPICGGGFATEEEVSMHIETCLSVSESKSDSALENSVRIDEDSIVNLETCVNAFVSGKPSEGSVEVILKLLKNVVKEPENAKFRKIRMGNPKIKEAIGDAVGAVELLECVGFKLKEENEDLWAVMEIPCENDLVLVRKAITLLEPRKTEELPPTVPSTVPSMTKEVDIPRKIDREVRVFFSTSESTAAKIELPDSFYNLSGEEIRRETEMRRKKLEESKLLIPKSYKEKQAKAARRMYNRTVIRVRFPDGVVLQGIFLPSEPTSALYEFVSSSLKEESLEFELINPARLKRKVIPHFPEAVGEKASTLEEEDLVPSALIKFLPKETEAAFFTGLRNDLLEIGEPLVSAS